jgi:hypothetical protein
LLGKLIEVWDFALDFLRDVSLQILEGKIVNAVDKVIEGIVSLTWCRDGADVGVLEPPGQGLDLHVYFVQGHVQISWNTAE